MGSGSDYSSFIQHAGIPALNLGYGGEGDGGEYHSIYDSYYDYTKFKDPGFQYGVTLAQTAGHAVLRMANADVLPFDFTHLYNTVNDYSNDLISLLQKTRESTDVENQVIKSGDYSVGEDPTKKFVVPVAKSEVPYLDFSPLQNALAELKKSADSLQACFSKQNKDQQCKCMLLINHFTEPNNNYLMKQVCHAGHGINILCMRPVFIQVMV